jgi:hypothetical protein
LLDANNLLAPYDDIAVEVVSSREPNEDVSLIYSNRELVEQVCGTMGWEDFDLFETHPFEDVHAAGVSDTCLAYAFIAFLRWRVFTTAAYRGVGVPAFSEKAAAHSEYWYIRLVERWNEKNVGAPKMRPWLN